MDYPELCQKVDYLVKNNIDFYQHMANADQHPKFKMLRVKYGWEGEGRFWALNNRIADSDNCLLDLEKGYNKMSIASDLGMTLGEFEEFILFLVNDCNLLIMKNNFITTEIVQENLIRVMKSRERNKSNYEKRNSDVDNTITMNCKRDENTSQHVENIQSKVKESKGKESKKEYSRERLNIFEQVIKYLNQRTGKKYKASTSLNRKFMNARISDGFVLKDFFHVIDVKTKQWIKTKDERYLRPETLFGNKFEGYVNETGIKYEDKNNQSKIHHASQPNKSEAYKPPPD